jgi:hypothetical protein
MKHAVALLVLAGAALLASAAPAFTADSGSVTVTVTAEAAQAPCLTLGTTSIDFGTVPFSTPTTPNGRNQAVGLTNCGAANETVTAVGTDASSTSGTWELVQRSGDMCAGGPNRYGLVVSWFEQGDADYRIYTDVTKTAATLRNAQGPFVFQPNQPIPARLGIAMPCQGSNSAGATKNLSVTFTAVAA